MNIEKELLSRKVIAEYDYKATKKNILELTEEIGMLEFRLKSLREPALAQGIQLRESQTSISKSSKQSNYVEEKVDLENEISIRKGEINAAIESLTNIEKLVYKKTIEQNLSCKWVAFEEKVYSEHISYVRSSAIIKMGILLNVVVYKKREKSL